MAQYVLRASSLEAVGVTQFVLTGSGTGNEANGVTSVRLVEDVNGDGALDAADATIATGAVFPADDGSVVFGGLARIIGASSQQVWLVVYDFSAGAEAGTFRVSVLQPSDVSATGQTSASSVTVTGPPATAETVTLSCNACGEPVYFMGGCGAGTGGGGFFPWLLLAAGLFIARRRLLAGGERRGASSRS
jgi:uncharacterized protein (TIGR03382 family)